MKKNNPTFEGTREAFKHLLSTPMWYYDVTIKGKKVTAQNASQIKRRFEGSDDKKITQDYMEEILLQKGYTIKSNTIWSLGSVTTEDSLDKAIEFVKSSFSNSNVGEFMLLGDVSELIKILTGKTVDVKQLTGS
jgi:hypothetical protein